MTSKEHQIKRCIQKDLSQVGFDKKIIDKAIHIYEENYPIYDKTVINEIIYQLTKDKWRICEKIGDKRFTTRREVKQALQNMQLHEYYIDTALKQYEMETVNEPEYDVVSIVGIIMELRAIDCCHQPRHTTKPYGSRTPSPKHIKLPNSKQFSESDTNTQTQTETETETETETDENLKSPSQTPKNHYRNATKTPEGNNEHSILSAYAAIAAVSKDKSDDIGAKIANIETEILTTELHYCDGLNVLLNELILPIFENKYVNKKYKSKFLSTVAELLEFHNGFLTELNTDFNQNRHSLANSFNKYILTNKENFLDIYLKFVRDYNDILDLLCATLHGNKLLDQFFKKMRKQKKSFLNYLILPIQRIPRYILLLRDLKKCDPNYDHIDCALSMIENIAQTFNSEQRKIENIAECLKIQSRLHGLKHSIVDPTNNRKFEGKFKFIEKNTQHSREFYVFNDIVIIANNKKRCKYILDVRTMDIKRDEIGLTNACVHVEFKLITGITKPMLFISESVANVNKLSHLIEMNRYQVLAQDVLELNGSVGSLKSQLARQLASIL